MSSKPQKRPEKYGHSQFEPRDEQRTAVRIMAGCGIPRERIRLAVINPITHRPVSKQTLEDVFYHELEVGSAEMDLVACSMLATQVRKGNMTAIIWYQKNRMGWSDQIDLSNRDGTMAGGIDFTRVPIVKLVFSDERLPNGEPPKQIELKAE